MKGYRCVQPLVLGVGVEKAATTWIHRQLESHPEVATTYTKELSFWLTHYQKGPDWYAGEFNSSARTKVYCEITPNYILQMDRLAERLKEAIETPRFIVVLRNPYDRTHSHYLDALRNGQTTDEFLVACTPTSEFVRKSLYTEDIRVILREFRREDLLVVLYDEISADPALVLQKIFTFLRVDPSYLPPDMAAVVNAGSGSSPASLFFKRLEGAVKKLGVSRRHFMRLGLGDIVDRIRRGLSKGSPKPELVPEQRRQLEAYFSSDIQALSKLLEVDLSHWR